VGVFKQIKDMKQAVAATPDLVDGAMQLGAQAQQMQAAQQQAAEAQAAQAAQAAAAAQPATGPDFEPVAGVSLATYAAISRDLQGRDASELEGIAAGHGVDAAAWEQAMTEFTARMQRNPAVAKEFNRHYTGG
jgi:hypothetical protein